MELSEWPLIFAGVEGAGEAAAVGAGNPTGNGSDQAASLVSSFAKGGAGNWVPAPMTTSRGLSVKALESFAEKPSPTRFTPPSRRPKPSRRSRAGGLPTTSTRLKPLRMLAAAMRKPMPRRKGVSSGTFTATPSLR